MNNLSPVPVLAESDRNAGCDVSGEARESTMINTGRLSAAPDSRGGWHSTNQPMSDTPRTDAEALKSCGGKLICVHADYARTLERELAAMTADRDSWRQQHAELVGDMLKVSGKRDKLLAELSAMTAERNSALADLNDLRIAYRERGEERDALRAKMECYDPYFRELDLLRHERDALKAENERLRAELTKYKWHVAGHPVGMAIGNQTMPSCDICNTASDGVALVCKERDALKAENEGLANLLWEHSKAPTDQDSVFASMDRVIELRKENERLRAQIDERNEMAQERDTLT